MAQGSASFKAKRVGRAVYSVTLQCDASSSHPPTLRPHIFQRIPGVSLAHVTHATHVKQVHSKYPYTAPKTRQLPIWLVAARLPLVLLLCWAIIHLIPLATSHDVSFSLPNQSLTHPPPPPLDLYSSALPLHSRKSTPPTPARELVFHLSRLTTFLFP